MPRPKRLSRTDKRDAILSEYFVKPVSAAAPVASPPEPPKATEYATPPSRFQATFYKELMVCDGTFCKALKYTTTETDDALRPRIQAIGYMYNMRGGQLTDEVKEKLKEVFAKVGIAYNPSAGQGQNANKQPTISRNNSINGD